MIIIYSSSNLQTLYYQVSVEMTDAVNVQLHISFNGMSNSEVVVMIEKAYNSSVHISFQNPVKTPVKVSFCFTITLI